MIPMRLGRQRLLSRGVEEAFRLQAFFQLLKRKLERAKTNGLEMFHVNLILAAGLVDAEGAAHGHLQTVLGAELDAALLLLEENAADLRAVVFQREIDVAGLGFVAVGDFALDQDVGEVACEEIADGPGEFGDREDAAFWAEVELELGHFNRVYSR